MPKRKRRPAERPKPRVHTRATKTIREIASRFPGNDAKTVHAIADFVFGSTRLKHDVFDRNTRFRRTAEDVLLHEKVDLLHCYDRCHALIALLSAKKVPSWMVVSMDYRNFVHSYVEAQVGGEIYTIAFKAHEKPIFEKGRVEEVVQHSPGSSFVRAREFSDLGVGDIQSFEAFVERMKKGRVRDSTWLPKQ
jgi:hypothetical protein